MAELPRGAVTFLFTDIEASTQLVRRLRDRYAEVLAEHQRLLREAFAKHGGYEIDTQGDAFFIAFSSAKDALLAAIEAQRAVSGFPWPDSAPVKVRMGIHTGQASPIDGRYTGLAVHRAARICAAGHGGQVLVSQATQSMLEDEEEDLAVRLRDLGEARLKDIERPVRVYQVTAAGLPAEFPPLRGEEEPSVVAPPLPHYRRPVVLVGAALALAGIAAAAALVLLSGGESGLRGVRPNHVGVIDPESGRILEEVRVGLRPGPIAADNSTIWVGNQDDRTLTRVDAAKREAAATVTIDNRTPTAIAVGEGGVWVAHGVLGSLSRVDPRYNRVTATVEDADADAITLGGGAVWTVRTSEIAKIDPATARVLGRSFAGGEPNAIAYGAGALWVTNEGGSTVYRYAPTTFEAGPVKEITAGRRPAAIAVGEGAVWVVNTGDDRVLRIDPLSNALTATIGVGDRPVAITVGRGAVWVGNSGDGTVSKIDPAANEVVQTTRTGSYPAGLAVGADYVWVTVQAK